MVCSERHPDDCESFPSFTLFILTDLRIQCATKSVIIHLQWQEGDEKHSPVIASNLTAQSPVSLSSSTSQIQTPGLTRTRTVSSLTRSTTSSLISSASRRPSVAVPTASGSTTAKGRLSVNGPRTPSTPASPRPTTPLFSVRYGRAAILTAPPKIVAIVETPDVAVGAVDPRKRRVVTATRFSSRAGADRRVSFIAFYFLPLHVN
jgi:pyrimidine and pyridine-specific 5'-nucleotidase